jgi:pimeloyl-ACP methyl ester carboxylesterase
MSGRELELRIGQQRLAARAWGSSAGEPTLAVHGWLDNAASFECLAPLLPELQLVALDLPGHGRSEHRPPEAVHHFLDWVPELAAAADALGWQRFSLIGHSMGAGIASLTPAAFPERVRRVVLLEGAGPLAAPAEAAPAQLRRALEDEGKLAAAPARVFPDLASAIAARRRDSDLDEEAARLLVARGTAAVDGGVRFRHDPRLKTRSRLRFTEEQVLAFLRAIPCPVLAVRARQGWPFPEEEVRARLAVIPDLQVAEVEGGHHVHMTNPERVAPLLRAFFSAPARG